MAVPGKTQEEAILSFMYEFAPGGGHNVVEGAFLLGG
jgi:hypothetical protein